MVHLLGDMKCIWQLQRERPQAVLTPVSPHQILDTAVAGIGHDRTRLLLCFPPAVPEDVAPPQDSQPVAPGGTLPAFAPAWVEWGLNKSVSAPARFALDAAARNDRMLHLFTTSVGDAAGLSAAVTALVRRVLPRDAANRDSAANGPSSSSPHGAGQAADPAEPADPGCAIILVSVAAACDATRPTTTSTSTSGISALDHPHTTTHSEVHAPLVAKRSLDS